MTVADDHICEDNKLSTGFRCHTCGEIEEFCKFCGENLHKCTQKQTLEEAINTIVPKPPSTFQKEVTERIQKKYRPIPGFPEYAMNSQGTIRSVSKQHFVLFVRLTSNGDALIMIYRDGIKHYKTVQELFALTFNRERTANEGL